MTTQFKYPGLKITALIMVGISIVVVLWWQASQATPKRMTAMRYTSETVLENLTVPWEMVFLADGSLMFTERNGRVRLYRNGRLLPKPLLQISNIDTTKKMGLMGLALHPAFEKNHYLYLSYNYRSGSAARLRVVRYLFQKDSLTDGKVIIENIPASQNHTGCRLKFGPDNKLYISTGDADEPAKAQQLTTYQGKILRVNDDGSIPADNPFTNQVGALKEIWSFGHRNPQGLAFQPGTGNLFISEHGPNGGDEINLVKKGANYGWPLIHHQQTADSMVSPLLEFTPSIGPAEAVFYTGKLFPQLYGHLLVACLRGEAILDIDMKGNQPVGHRFLVEKEYGRIRAIAVSADGNIYFSTSQKDPPEGKPLPGSDKIVKLVLSTVDAAQNSKSSPLPQKTMGENTKTTAALFQELCAGCHGKSLEGNESVKRIDKNSWKYGGTVSRVVASISHGYPQKGMPAWKSALSDEDIRKLALYMIGIADKNKKMNRR